MMINPTLVYEEPTSSSSLIFKSSIDKIVKAASETGWLLQPISNKDFSNLGSLSYVPTFVYGSIQFVKSIRIPLNPGIIGYNGYEAMTHLMGLPRTLLFNKTGMVTSWNDLNNNFDYFSNLYGNRIFVRPKQGSKVFAGQVMSKYELDLIHASTGVIGSTEIFIDVERHIDNEIRVFVIDGKVVSCSPYLGSLDNEYVRNTADIQTAIEFVEAILPQINTTIEMEKAFVIDIAIVANSASILEINSISSSGVYEANCNDITTALRSFVLKEFMEGL